MRYMKHFLAASTALACSASLSADDIAVVGGKVMTMNGETIDGGTVLISGSTIQAVGQDIEVPAGYRVIDASGKVVTPGFMVSNTSLGLNEGPSGAGSNEGDATKAKKPVTLDVTWGLNPDTTVIPVQRVEGITRTSVNFSRYKGAWSGQGAVIHLGEGSDMVAKAMSHMALGIDGRSASEAGGRAALWSSIFEKLDKAKKHLETASDSEDGDDKKKNGKPDPESDVLAKVLQGEMTLVVRADKASDLTKVIKLGERYPGIKMAISGAAEAWRVADQLAEAKIPVIISGTQNLPSGFERMASTMQNAARLSSAGVDVAFVGNGSHRAHLARQHAGIAVANGMDMSAALAALTTVPASIFGVSESYGTLEAGKDADIVVWDGDPLELMTNTDAVIIRGELQSSESRQTKLRDRYLDTPRSPQFK